MTGSVKCYLRSSISIGYICEGRAVLVSIVHDRVPQIRERFWISPFSSIFVYIQQNVCKWRWIALLQLMRVSERR